MTGHGISVQKLYIDYSYRLVIVQITESDFNQTMNCNSAAAFSDECEMMTG